MDIEWELEHIKTFDNAKQLRLLLKEIGHIIEHGLIPCEGWYDERYEYIDLYSQLAWIEFADKFKSYDNYIYETTIQILYDINNLIEERGSKPNFNINTYYRVIHNIYNVWNYYSTKYMGDNDDISNLFNELKI